MNTFRPKFFVVQELVGPEMYKRFGERCWEFIRADLLVTLDTLRERYGKIKINDWHQGGSFHESGLRDFSTSTGAEFSQHKFGGAADTKYESCTPEEVSKDILAHPENTPLLTTLENVQFTKTWLHIDVRNHGYPYIWVVIP